MNVYLLVHLKVFVSPFHAFGHSLDFLFARLADFPEELVTTHGERFTFIQALSRIFFFQLAKHILLGITNKWLLSALIK